MDTKARIFQAAHDLFIERGFTATGTKDIAKQADVNKAMIHYYFDTKENLFREVCREAINKTFVAAQEMLNSDMELFSKLRSYIDTVYDQVRNEADIHRFLISELNLNNRLITDLFVEAADKNLSPFREQIADAADNYEIARIDYRVLLMNIHSLCIYPFMMQQWYLHEERMPSDYLGTEGHQSHKQMISDVIFTWLTN